MVWRLVILLTFLQGSSSIASALQDDTAGLSSFARIIARNSEIPGYQRFLREGDIIISGQSLLPQHLRGRSTLCLACQVWPWNSQTGKYYVPFKIGLGYEASEEAIIMWAMQHIMLGSNIRFVPHTFEVDYVEFTAGKGCSSYIGREGGRQAVVLEPHVCVEPQTVLHEILHALGMGHEHQRPDRDNYVKILKSNMLPTEHNQVELDPNMKEGHRVTPYDFASIMHYDSRAFSFNSQPVLLPHAEEMRPLIDKEKVTLSSCDWHRLNALYPGEVPAPPCVPHEQVSHCEPTEQCLAAKNAQWCEITCLQNCSRGYKVGKCVFRSGHDFPELPQSQSQ